MIRPRWYNEHAMLAAVARELHRRCRERCRTAVDADTMPREQAAAALRVRRAITVAWLALAAIEPEPAGIDDPETNGAWPFERRIALRDELAIARVAAEAAPDDFEIVGFADAVETLLWWETANPTARLLVDVTIEGRRRGALARTARETPTTLFPMGEAA